MTIEAIRAGMGGMVLDPTGELTALTLARIPAERVGDVDLLDLGDTHCPPALNLLACAPGESDAHAGAVGRHTSGQQRTDATVDTPTTRASRATATAPSIAPTIDYPPRS
jgi:hypothetical protein